MQKCISGIRLIEVQSYMWSLLFVKQLKLGSTRGKKKTTQKYLELFHLTIISYSYEAKTRHRGNNSSNTPSWPGWKITLSDGCTAQHYWHDPFQSQEKMNFFQNCYWEASAWKCAFRHCCRLFSQKRKNIARLPAKMCFTKIEIQFQCCQLQYIDGIGNTAFDPQVWLTFLWTQWHSLCETARVSLCTEGTHSHF